MAGRVAVEAQLDAEALAALRERFRGPVLTPDDLEYDEARSIWNALIDRRPALIAQCSGAADVVDAVNFAREQGLVLSINSNSSVRPSTPFGGFKRSGFGRELGVHGLAGYSEVKNVFYSTE